MSAPVQSRTCFRCGRGFTGKAGRVVDGKPACPPCGNALRPEVECAACGRATKRPSRSDASRGLVCKPCARRATHGTCRRCRRHRKIARRDGEGRPVCSACGADAPATHACLGCGEDTPGTGAARCPGCALTDRVARRVEAEAGTMPAEWSRELFRAFCASGDLRKARGDMPRHIGAYAGFFRALGAQLAGAAEVTQARLLALHGAEGLRRQFQAVRFLMVRLSLPWDAPVTEEATERARADARVAAAAGRSWAEDLAAYRATLAEGQPIAPRTRRMYVAAAADFLAGSGVERAAELTQAHLERHLRRRPGQSANLMRFLTWISETSGQGFRRPRKSPARVRARQRAVLGRAAALLARLTAADDLREGRALLAAAVSVVHGVPLVRVLALRTSEATAEQGLVRLWPGRRQVALSGPLADGYGRFAARQGAYAFPGRNAVQPLSSAAVGHHLRALGLPACAAQPRCCRGKRRVAAHARRA